MKAGQNKQPLQNQKQEEFVAGPTKNYLRQYVKPNKEQRFAGHNKKRKHLTT